MKKNQLFKKMPTMELFERFVKIFGLTDINDCRKFTRDTLLKNNTLEKFEGFVEELEEYYIPCKVEKYLKDLDEKKLITVLRQIAKTFEYNVISNEKYLNSRKVLQYSLEKNSQINEYVNYNLKIIEF
jgi:hypothetical protein